MRESSALHAGKVVWLALVRLDTAGSDKPATGLGFRVVAEKAHVPRHFLLTL
jgi:hypothetical protein